jgi:hypothetical protein
LELCWCPVFLPTPGFRPVLWNKFLERVKKIRWTGLGLVKKEKQLNERICVLFLLNLRNKDVHLILAQILKKQALFLSIRISFATIARPSRRA